MFIDTKKNQQFLALLYSLQNNLSNAVIEPKYLARKIEKGEVYRAYDFNKGKYGKWIYSLQPIQNIPKAENLIIDIGGRPKILTDVQRQQVKTWKAKNISNREIAKRLKVSEGTIRNEIKRMGRDI